MNRQKSLKLEGMLRIHYFAISPSDSGVMMQKMNTVVICFLRSHPILHNRNNEHPFLSGRSSFSLVWVGKLNFKHKVILDVAHGKNK